MQMKMDGGGREDEEMPANPEREISMAAEQQGDMGEDCFRYARNWKDHPGERLRRILEW